MDKVEKCCKTCYCYNAHKNLCEHEDMKQKVVVAWSEGEMPFCPPDPDEFFCSLWW